MGFPVISFILECFKIRPEFVEDEDEIPTSPGTPMHYFACFNYLEGAKILLQEPFLATPGKRNKNGLTPLWIAAWYNNTRIGTELLRAGADANEADPDKEISPLHCAIYGYHITR